MAFDRTIAVATLMIAVLGLGGLYFQVRSAARAQELDHRRQRQQATLEWAVDAFDRLWLKSEDAPDPHEFDAVRTFAARPLDDGWPPNSVIAEWLDVMEDLATGVNMGVYDLMVVERLIGVRVKRQWRNLQPWIVAHRDHRDQPSLYVEFELMARDLYRLDSGPDDVRDAPEFG